MKFARTMVKKWLGVRGLRLAREPRILIERPEIRLDFRLQHVLALLASRKKDVFLVEVGANDGMTDDPVYEFIRRHGWRGVLVEPQPAVFERLRQNYSDCPGIALKCGAISEHPGSRPMFTLPELPFKGHMFQGNTLACFDRDALLRYRFMWADVDDYIREVNVECITWDGLIGEFAIERADLIVIDTEGFDYQVLRMAPIQQLGVSVVLMEHVHLSPADRDAAWSLLAADGFKLLIDGANTIATRGI